MDKYSGVCTGDEEVYLLCEKVNKKEIKIRFFEVDADGNQIWEAYGQFMEADVHHQVAIVFRTPAYRDTEIVNSVQVYLQLFRPKDGEYSEPRPFTYRPRDRDIEGVERKRLKLSHYDPENDDNNNNPRHQDNNHPTLDQGHHRRLLQGAATTGNMGSSATSLASGLAGSSGSTSHRGTPQIDALSSSSPPPPSSSTDPHLTPFLSPHHEQFIRNWAQFQTHYDHTLSNNNHHQQITHHHSSTNDDASECISGKHF